MYISIYTQIHVYVCECIKNIYVITVASITLKYSTQCNVDVCICFTLFLQLILLSNYAIRNEKIETVTSIDQRGGKCGSLCYILELLLFYK